MLLLALVLILGVIVLQLMRVTAIQRTGDRFFLAAWTGLVCLSVILLCWALIAPIGPFTCVTLAGIGSFLVFMNPDIRSELRSFAHLFTPTRIGLGMILALVVAYAEVQTICDRDVIIYHLDNIHTLSRTGTIPGLGLIYHRYGFVSSWFTIPAMFNHGFLTMRIAPAANGLVFLLMLGQLQAVAGRILNRRGEGSDWFILAAFTIATVIPVFLNYAVSTTPDFILITGNMIIAWASVMIYGGLSSPLATNHRQQLLPVLLASSMFTIKMLALPMIAATGLIYLIYRRFQLRAWIISGVIVATVVTPFLITLTLLTGYPLYPNPLFRMELPWTMNPDSYHLTHDKWGMSGETDAAYLSWDWLMAWIQFSPDNKIGLALFVLSWMLLLWIAARNRSRMWHVMPCLMIGVIGMMFLVAKAPSVRFGWSYLSIIPCTMFYLYSDSLNAFIKRWPGALLNNGLRQGAPLAVWIAFVLGVSVLGKTASEKMVQQAVEEGRLTLDRPNFLFYAPLPPRILFDDIKRRAEPYREFEDDPAAYLDSPRPMFHPLIPGEGVRYLIPETGIYGGFSRDQSTGNLSP